MPQMAPILWSYLFIIFNVTTLILMTKIFFQTTFNLTSDVNPAMSKNKKNWKL